MIFDHLQQCTTGMVGGIQVAPGSLEIIKKAHEIRWPHAAVRIQQNAEVRIRIDSHWGFIQEASDTLVVPDFVDDLGFVYTH